MGPPRIPRSFTLLPRFMSSAHPSSRPPRPAQNVVYPDYYSTSPMHGYTALPPEFYPSRTFPMSRRSVGGRAVQVVEEEPEREYSPRMAAARAEYDSVINKWAFPGARKDANIELRCTIFDSKGDVSQRTARKSVLCGEHGLDPRDLRKVDASTPNLVPSILVRKEAIIITVLHVRALVKADTVIVFDTVGRRDSKLQSQFITHLTHNLKIQNSTIPFEFRALESILISVAAALEAEMSYTRQIVSDLLETLEHNIDRERLRNLLYHSRRLTAFKARAQGVMEAVEELLDNDEDMTAMYLTDKQSRIDGSERAEKDHEEIEMILESSQRQVEEIVNEVVTTISNVESTQDIVELILDSNRNKLLAIDLKVSIGTLGVGSSAAIAGLFGMNLQTHYEAHPFAWYGVSTFALVLGIALTHFSIRHLNKVMKIGLRSSASHEWDFVDGQSATQKLLAKQKRASSGAIEGGFATRSPVVDTGRFNGFKRRLGLGGGWGGAGAGGPSGKRRVSRLTVSRLSLGRDR